MLRAATLVVVILVLACQVVDIWFTVTSVRRLEARVAAVEACE